VWKDQPPDYILSDPAMSVFQAVLPLVDSGRTEAFFPHLASDDFYFTGLAALNLDSEPTDVTVTVYNPGGEPIESQTWSLKPGARFAKLIPELFAGLPAMTRGYFRVRASRQIAAHAVFGTRTLTALSAIPAQ
jgi:phytoene dehydrogenase-like protein